MKRAHKPAATVPEAATTDASALRVTCWVIAAVGVLSTLVGYPLLLDGALGIGLGSANIRAEVLPVGLGLVGFGVVVIAAAVGLWHRSVATWRTVILALLVSAVVVQLVPLDEAPAVRVGITLVCGAVAAWLVRPVMRRLFAGAPKAPS